MNSYKIEELTIVNFKCIDSATFYFRGNSLVVFDGPNGYGKTTTFEALEILFTKIPRKIATIKLDKRYTYRNSPIHKLESARIEISATLVAEDGTKLNIKRIFPPASIDPSRDNNIHKIFGSSVLYINNEEIHSDTEEHLAEILAFTNLDKMFSILNYVEQDENTYFLKEDPKNRYKALVSLLGGDEERRKLEHVETFMKKLQERIDLYQQAIDGIKEKNLELLSKDNHQKDFSRLIEGVDSIWDRIEVNNTDTSIHDSYLEEIGKVADLVNNSNEIENIVLTGKLNKFNNDSFINSFVKHYWSVTNFEALKTERESKRKNSNTITNNNEILDYINKADYTKLNTDKYSEILGSKSDITINLELFKAKLALLNTLHETLSLENQILSDLKDRRSELVRISRSNGNFMNLKDSECPTCGYDWENADELIKQIETTEAKLFESYNRSNRIFEEEKKKLSEEFLEQLNLFLNEENANLHALNSNLIEDGAFSLLLDLQASLEPQFNSFLVLFNEDNRSRLINLVNFRYVANATSAASNIEKIIYDSTPKLRPDIDTQQSVDNFEKYFKGNIDQIKKITPKMIADKLEYVQWQYYNAINNEIVVNEAKKKKLNNAFIEVRKIWEILNTQIKNYTNSIINKISIPFHIYTGKILQNHSLGSGLIIDFETEREDPQVYIRPVNKDQEVTFTLSSGQLSATVISLMLVLNKVFNHSRFGTILIDDPLQTLDEINAHSLVELLKYNFMDQQLIISTHEDRYSQFIRYKYEKFGLNSSSIGMKDIV